MEIKNLPIDKKIILFDGVCNLCATSVQLIVQKDRKDLFRFVALQSELGLQILKHIGVDSKKTDSIILYEPGIAYYYKGEAVLKIASEIGGIYRLLHVASILPLSVLNWMYDYVARNRYKWYGKKDNCMLPTAEIQAKFL